MCDLMMYLQVKIPGANKSMSRVEYETSSRFRGSNRWRGRNGPSLNTPMLQYEAFVATSSSPVHEIAVRVWPFSLQLTYYW